MAGDMRALLDEERVRAERLVATGAVDRQRAVGMLCAVAGCPELSEMLTASDLTLDHVCEDLGLITNDAVTLTPEVIAATHYWRRKTGGVDQARAEGFAAGLEYAETISDLCVTAGQPALAPRFVFAKIPVQAARSRLLELRAARTDENPISAWHGARPSEAESTAAGWRRAAQMASGEPAQAAGPSPAGRRARDAS